MEATENNEHDDIIILNDEEMQQGSHGGWVPQLIGIGIYCLAYAVNKRLI